MNSTYRQRTGHDRTRLCKKSKGPVFQQRRKKAMELLEEDLRIGRLRQAGMRTDIPLTEEDVKRIKKEIENIKEKM